MLKCPNCGTEIDLVGTKEASEVLGVSTSTFQSLKARDDFPAPAVTVGQGALWFREDVLAWKRSRSAASVTSLAEKLRGEMAAMSVEEREQVLASLKNS